VADALFVGSLSARTVCPGSDLGGARNELSPRSINALAGLSIAVGYASQRSMSDTDKFTSQGVNAVVLKIPYVSPKVYQLNQYANYYYMNLERTDVFQSDRKGFYLVSPFTTRDVDTDNPLVSSQQAADAARNALDRIGSENDWTYQLEVTNRTEDNDMAYSVNQRLELRFGDQYVEPTADHKVDSVILKDPIDDVTYPYLQTVIHDFTEAEQYADIPLLSTRELHLIIAEHALANEDEQLFKEHINTVRQFSQLTDYEDQLPAVEILKHERRVNLFLQGRRLADLYRFQESAPTWVSSRVENGTFFPITITEIRSNPNVDL
jgi:hypothetical protein